MKRTILSAVLGLLTAYAGAVSADIITEYTSLTAYNAAVGAHTIVTFAGDSGTITTQHSSEGVTFTDGNDTKSGTYVAGNGQIHLSFSSLMNHLGVEFPGALVIDLYLGSTLIDTSSNFAGSGSGFFGGTLSTAFNGAVLRDWADDAVFIEKLHFGSTAVPEPASLALLGLGLFGLGFSRRKKA